jgi:hypothetical protein
MSPRMPGLASWAALGAAFCLWTVRPQCEVEHVAGMNALPTLCAARSALPTLCAALQDAADATNPSSLMAAAASNSSREYTDAARSIIVAIAANRSREVSAAVGCVVLSAYAENNTQVS